MDNVGKGMIAGLAATIVVSVVIMLMDPIVPEASIITAYGRTGTNILGIENAMAIGWFLHLFVGIVLWGGLFGAFNHLIPGNTELNKGLWFSVFAWLVMMVVIMPFAGAGLFSMEAGLIVPVVTLVLHLIYGAVLGIAYARAIHVRPTQVVMA